MLICRQAEFALVNLGDLPQPSLEIAAGLVLYAPVLDEASKMMLAICARLPTKVVDITVESVRAGRMETESEKFLNLRFERIEAHAVDCVFQTCVLSAEVKTFHQLGHRSPRRQECSLDPVAVVPLHEHDFLCSQNTLFWCHEAENAACAGVRLLVTVRNTHTATRGHVEAGQLATLVDNSDEADVVREYIDIVGWWDSNSNFKLKCYDQLFDR